MAKSRERREDRTAEIGKERERKERKGEERNVEEERRGGGEEGAEPCTPVDLLLLGSVGAQVNTTPLH